MTFINIIVISIVTLIILIALRCEGRDMNKALPKKVFQDGKIESLFEYTVYLIRSLIISAVILILSLTVGIISFSAKNIVIFLIISMLVIYFQFNFYSYHQDRYIIKSFDCSYNEKKSSDLLPLEKPVFLVR